MAVYDPEDDRLYMSCFYRCKELVEGIGLPIGQTDQITVALAAPGYSIVDGRKTRNFEKFGTIFKRWDWGFEMVSDGSVPDLQFVFSFTNEELSKSHSWRCLEPYKLMGFPKETNEKA